MKKQKKTYFEIQQEVEKTRLSYQNALQDCLALFKKCNVDYKHDRGNIMVQFYNVLKFHYGLLNREATEGIVEACQKDMAKFRPALDQILKDNGMK